ncbi:MAG: hypothetical protein QOK42_1227 [Frankiaceae bacterium]|jgi:hypothetical protein|nr:hypothetical protein [Frankiaceae bacterium]
MAEELSTAGSEALDAYARRVLAAVALLEAQGVPNPDADAVAEVTCLDAQSVVRVLARLAHLDQPLLEPLDYASVGPANNAGLTGRGRFALGAALVQAHLSPSLDG